MTCEQIMGGDCLNTHALFVQNLLALYCMLMCKEHLICLPHLTSLHKDMVKWKLSSDRLGYIFFHFMTVDQGHQ